MTDISEEKYLILQIIMYNEVQADKIIVHFEVVLRKKNLILITNKRKKSPSSIDAEDSIEIRTATGWPTSTSF